jgi:hypothetical protein
MARLPGTRLVYCSYESSSFPAEQFETREPYGLVHSHAKGLAPEVPEHNTSGWELTEVSWQVPMRPGRKEQED